jgi:hypothetical protein
MSEYERHAAAGDTRLLDRLDDPLPRLRRLARLGVVLCVAVALSFGLVYFVKAVDRLGVESAGNAALNFDDREFAGGNGLVVANDALYEARALIPEDEAYRIVPGPHVEGATELTETYIDQFARYFLMPRRPAAEARWILCYGCDPASLDESFEVVWRNDRGMLLGRLAE